MRKSAVVEKTAPKKSMSKTAAKATQRHSAVSGKPRTVRIDARIPAHVKEIVQYAAGIQGRSQTDFMVTAIHEAAQKVIADNAVVRLCVEDQRRLAAALAGGASSTDAKGLARLRRAVRDHGKKVESP